MYAGNYFSYGTKYFCLILAIEACKNAPENKAFKQLKKGLIKEDESLLNSIRYLQREVEKHFLPEKALEVYMSDESLIWLEKEVIE